MPTRYSIIVNGDIIAENVHPGVILHFVKSIMENLMDDDLTVTIVRNKKSKEDET
jgi:hypothetical protein